MTPKELAAMVEATAPGPTFGIVSLKHFAALMERYERMRAALAYYANKSNYASKLTPGGGSWYMEIELDDGDRAIEAIADADKPLESRS